jgi:biotin carboxyl carrier protein
VEIHYRAGERVETVAVTRSGPGVYRVVVGGRPHEAVLRRAHGGALDLVFDGRPLRAFVAEDGPRRFVQLAGEAPVAFLRAETRRAAAPRRAAGGEESLTANMHAQVVAILAGEGDEVERGQALVVLEAMKMELRIAAPHKGRVRSIACKVGEVVERGRVLLELEAAP